MLPQVFLCLLMLIRCHGYQSSWNSDHNHHKTPQDAIVDVVNNVALKLLAIHNEGNDNNIAISPYGAVSVLVALLEGVRGEAGHEIQHAANIPSDMSVVRIGLRDINRHLKSYFIPEEGFLSGLTLSHENVTLNREYEDILKFYGYDINSFNNALYPDSAHTTGPPETTTESSTDATTEPTSKREETTTEMPTTTAGGGSQVTAIATNIMTSEESTEVPRSTTEMTTSTWVTPTTESAVEESTTGTTSTTPVSEVPSTTTLATTLFTSNEVEVESGDTVASTTPTESDRIQEMTPTVTTEMETTTEPGSTTVATTEPSTGSTGMTTTEATSEMTSTRALMTTEMSDNGTTERSVQNNESLRRGARSLVDYIIARYHDDHSITQRPPPYNSEKDLYFLVNGKYKETNINYMTYDTVLPFHYVPHLGALALRFPLDSSKYYLLLLLPEDEDGIEKLICDLRLNTSLKYIISNLRYTHVKAVIPSFMLKGYIILTSTFQKMGIRKVFEPRHADFTPMTSDPNIYVTNIEQAITVNIKNYVDPITMNSNRYLHQNDPVLFKADHPFLYFVIDSEIDVTLMAGKVINPLNSRIR